MEDKSFKTIDAIFPIITLICLSWTVFNCAQGYGRLIDDEVGGWIFAIVIGLAILVLTIYIKSNFEKGVFPIAAIIFYVIVVAVDISANFNKFFSNSIEDKALLKEITDLESDVIKLKIKSHKAITDYNQREKLIDDSKQLRINLKEQILDEGMPGCGPRCGEIVKQVEKLLATTLTEPYGQPAVVAKSYDRQIEEKVNNKILTIDAKYKGINYRLDNDINVTLTKLGIVKRSGDKKRYLSVIDSTLKVYNSIGEEIQGTINNVNVFSFNRKDIQNPGIGLISNIAYYIPKYPREAFTALVQSLIINIIVPFLVFIFYFSPKKINNARTRFPKKTTGTNEKFLTMIENKGIKNP